jgi:hypothetical protein
MKMLSYHFKISDTHHRFEIRPQGGNVVVGLDLPKDDVKDYEKDFASDPEAFLKHYQSKN